MQAILKTEKTTILLLNSSYDLEVGAWDGQFGNQTHVEITVLNVNDMKPRFKQLK